MDESRGGSESPVRTEPWGVLQASLGPRSILPEERLAAPSDFHCVIER